MRRVGWLGAAALGLVLLATAAACFTLDISNGAVACSSDPKRACPSGYSCIDDRCWSKAPDGGETDGGF